MSDAINGKDKSPTFRHIIRNQHPSTIFLILGCIVLAFFAYDTQTKSLQPSTSNRASLIATKNGNEAPRTKFRTSTTFCNRTEVKDKGVENGFKSQRGEDKILMGWFNGLCGGTYIEMGALDGVTFSNSFAFNEKLGWKGLMVELSPKNYAKLIKKRENELATVNAGACEVEQTLHWLSGISSGVGGIWEFAAPSFRAQWWKGQTLEKDGKPIECLPMKVILERHVKDVKYFDFWSLDVEGAELEVLKSVDYTEVGFGVIFVEADDHNQLKNLAILTFLESKGYIFWQEKERSWWFVNKDFFDIYGEMIHSPFL
jgi:hypothetical protein